MADVKVLVVDDSAAMRALFCGILDEAKGISVCGTAANADDAREKISECKPDVLTLDVEMPGMSGMEFLTEVMETRPMPVIMLSSITQDGSGTAQQAIKLGAVHCFPKPLKCAGEEFNKIVIELGDIVRRAAAGELTPASADGTDEEEQSPKADFEPNGTIVAIAGGEAGIEPIKRLLADYPPNCPPTLVLIDASEELQKEKVAALGSSVACSVEAAMDGQALEPGRVYLAMDKSRHFVVEAGSPPRVRHAVRDPVAGFRPSADLLMGSLARAKIKTVAGLMPGTGQDGVKGLQILKAGGANSFVQRPAAFDPADRYDAAKGLNFGCEVLDADKVTDFILAQTAQG